jgi:16S rRNA (cytidine1402-2'-O)-methyltransferase
LSRPAAKVRAARACPGRLVLVATPIGNLEDMSPRAVRELEAADVVACEDTRRTRRLLSHSGIQSKRLVAVHDHNEARQTRSVLSLLERGLSIAVVTDAGMPGISDPGARLVAAASSAGADVSVVPGPSAAVSALVVSGLPSGRYVFEGFLPRRGPQRAERIAAIASERRTTLIYEAPHRLASTLADLAAACGPLRQAAVVRELTKLHEEVLRGTLSSALERAREAPPRGEHVIVVAGAPEGPGPGAEELEESVAGELASGKTPSEAAAEVARELGVPRRRAYDVAVALRSRSRP